jgi:hypothetical protein
MRCQVRRMNIIITPDIFIMNRKGINTIIFHTNDLINSLNT